MKYPVLFVLSVVLAITGCDYAAFDRYPGERLTEIPDMFVADYRFDEEKNNGDANLKLEVRKQGFTITDDGKRQEYSLNDTHVVLSRYGNTYFISFRQLEPEPHFNIMFLERKNKKYLELKAVMAKSKEEMNSRAQEFFGAPRIAEKDGHASEEIYSTNEEKLLAYYDKYLRKQKGFLFKRIKRKEK